MERGSRICSYGCDLATKKLFEALLVCIIPPCFAASAALIWQSGGQDGKGGGDAAPEMPLLTKDPRLTKAVRNVSRGGQEDLWIRQWPVSRL